MVMHFSYIDGRLTSPNLVGVIRWDDAAEERRGVEDADEILRDAVVDAVVHGFCDNVGDGDEKTYEDEEAACPQSASQ